MMMSDRYLWDRACPHLHNKLIQVAHINGPDAAIKRILGSCLFQCKQNAKMYMIAVYFLMVENGKRSFRSTVRHVACKKNMEVMYS